VLRLLRLLRLPLTQLLSLRAWRRIIQALSAVQLGLVLLFPLHAPVLEPNLDLSLGQAQGMSNLYPPPSCQVPVEVELLLQLQRLVARVGLSSPLPFCKGRNIFRPDFPFIALCGNSVGKRSRLGSSSPKAFSFFSFLSLVQRF